MDLTSQNFHIVFDSRSCKNGSVFVAFSFGVRDGHDFINAAISNGAKYVICEKEVPVPADVTLHVVENSLDFITKQAAARFVRMKNSGTKTIAITGSIGKTTTKEFCKFLLSKHGKTFATEGNLNNHIGVPLTILNAPLECDFLILEMGMNHKGEIAHLIKMAPCDVRIITSIHETHSGNFEDGINGVANAKMEILNHNLQKGGYNITSDSPFLAHLSNIEKVSEGLISNYEIKNNATYFNFLGKSYRLNGIFTKQYLISLCFGLTLLHKLSLSLPDDISSFAVPNGRGNIVKIGNCMMINDAYNASPASMVNALKTFKQYSGKKAVIIGQMRELGELALLKHLELIEFLSGIDLCIFVAGEMRNVYEKYNGEKLYFEDYTKLLEYLKQYEGFASDFDAVLVKASHGVLLYKLFEDLYTEAN